jgi:Tfp pilus assembly protein PilF
MEKIIFLLLLIISGNILFAQNKEEAGKLVAEGVALHDKEDYNGAIVKYDKALDADVDNLIALAEKALSLLVLQKFDESISCCKKAIQKHPNDDGLKTVYVTYGNALDAINKTEMSVKIYDEGIKQFPGFYQLYFNKGITLSGAQKYDEALLCFQSSVMLNPKHSGSHNAIARILSLQNNKIPSLLAFCRFLIIESEGNRAKENLESVQKIMKGNVTKTGEKSVTINLSPDLFGDARSKGKGDNNFSSIELILGMTAALDYNEYNIKKTEVDQFIRKFETVLNSLKEGKINNTGFYWNYYVPYFVEMKDRNMVSIFAHIAFAPSNDPAITDWLNAHKEEINNFYDWSGLFKWN